jgi:hypothetical protein
MPAAILLTLFAMLVLLLVIPAVHGVRTDGRNR